jgi:crotonobetainyl-CoA:carnitine CoA-transferase CaiB-like acyl-CoA transferase
VFTRIYSMADIFKDPHYKARRMLARVEDEDLGSVTLTAPVPRLSKTPGRIVRTGGHIGRDTRRVLKSLLGLDDGAINRLEGDKIVLCAPHETPRAEEATL